MALLSEQGYKNAGVNILKIKETGALWVNMKCVGDGLGVNNTSDLVLKKYVVFMRKKNLTKDEINNYKMTEREIFEKFATLNNDELNTKSSKFVYVKNNVMANIIKHCIGEKKEV